jgi:hypothetical protein
MYAEFPRACTSVAAATGAVITLRCWQRTDALHRQQRPLTEGLKCGWTILAAPDNSDDSSDSQQISLIKTTQMRMDNLPTTHRFNQFKRLETSVD